MEFRWDNFLYLIEYRKLLRGTGLLPALLRVEYHKGYNDFTNTDAFYPIKVYQRPHLRIGNKLCLNMNNPHMAIIFLDHELASEHIASPSFNEELSRSAVDWGIIERSAIGLCFENIPKNFHFRYVVMIDPKTGQAPEYTWIWHLPDNYANFPGPFGKVKMSELFDFGND